MIDRRGNSEPADSLRRRSEAIVSLWAAGVRSTLRRCDADLPAEAVEESCRTGLAALIHHLESGAPTAFDTYVERVIESRLRIGADLGQLADEGFLLLGAALPCLLGGEGKRGTVFDGPERMDRFLSSIRVMFTELLTSFTRRKRAQLRLLAVRRERQRVAQQIHDYLTQSIYGVGLLAEAAERHMDRADPAAVSAALRRIKGLVQDSLAEMRICLLELRQPSLDREGLTGAIRALLEIAEERAGLKTSLRVEGRARPPMAVEEQVLGIAAELLNNTLKHARAERVSIVLRQSPPGLCLEVIDDGAGFDPAEGRRRGGLGLIGMEARARKIGGELRIDSAPGRGTHALLAVPLEQSDRAYRGRRNP